MLVNELKQITGQDFEAIDESSLMLDPDSGGARQTVSPDSIPPTISIVLPTDGTTVTGSSVTVSADALDDVGVVGVQFRLDGANLGSEVMTPPYSISWNTTAAGNGAHFLTALARDAAGNTTTSSVVSITVSNVAGGSSGSSGGGGGGCFIATAAYGSALEPEVVLLRTFRDRHLLSTPAGQAFVQWYYRASPPLAAEIKKSPALRTLVRGILWPLVGIVWLILHPWLGMVLLMGGILWKTRRCESAGQNRHGVGDESPEEEGREEGRVLRLTDFMPIHTSEPRKNQLYPERDLLRSAECTDGAPGKGT